MGCIQVTKSVAPTQGHGISVLYLPACELPISGKDESPSAYMALAIGPSKYLV